MPCLELRQLQSYLFDDSGKTLAPSVRFMRPTWRSPIQPGGFSFYDEKFIALHRTRVFASPPPPTHTS